MKHEAYCKVCLVEHDEEMHQATLNIREWHRWEVVKGFAEVDDLQPAGEEIAEPMVAA